ncbi:MAG TPA: NUDIX domain-containing protein [Mycobacteriales bacterium]|nr:NUDIX domain-containing protein [Mycobacteriales bacterium]
MPVQRSALLIPAPLAAVREVCRERASFRVAGVPIDRRGLVADGDQLSGLRVRVREPGSIALAGRRLRYEQELIEVGDGTLLVQEVGGPRAVRPGVRAEWIRGRVLASVPVVVAGAVVAGGKLLVAQRAHPDELAGRYELPGGKVEPGEPSLSALVREWDEELGVQIVPGRRIGPDIVLGRRVLRVWRARIRSGVPEAREHAGLRWVGPRELAGLDWLPADRALLPDLRVLLRT